MQHLWDVTKITHQVPAIESPSGNAIIPVHQNSLAAADVFVMGSDSKKNYGQFFSRQQSHHCVCFVFIFLLTSSHLVKWWERTGRRRKRRRRDGEDRGKGRKGEKRIGKEIGIDNK